MTEKRRVDAEPTYIAFIAAYTHEHTGLWLRLNILQLLQSSCVREGAVIVI